MADVQTFLSTVNLGAHGRGLLQLLPAARLLIGRKAPSSFELPLPAAT